MSILEILKVIIIGIVEGITEWLPISSTGHSILVEQLFMLNAGEEYKAMFEVVIQLGAILAVVVLYFKKLNPFSKGINTKKMYLTIELWKKITCIYEEYHLNINIYDNLRYLYKSFFSTKRRPIIYL